MFKKLNGGWEEIWKGVLSVHPARPSFFPSFLSPLFYLSKSIHTPRFVNIFLLALLIFSVYECGKLLSTPEVGFYSAIFLLSFPGIAAFSKLFYMEFPLTCFLVTSFFFLISSRNLRKRSQTTLFSLFYGLCAITKVTFVFFSGWLLPWCWKLVKRRKIKRLIYPFSVFLLIVVPLFLPKFMSIASWVSKSWGDVGVWYVKGEYWKNISSYTWVFKFLKDNMSVLSFSLFFLTIFLLPFKMKAIDFKSKMLIFTILFSYLSLTILPIKTWRMSIPLLPFISLWTVHFLHKFFKDWREFRIVLLFLFILSLNEWVNPSLLPHGVYDGKGVFNTQQIEWLVSMIEDGKKVGIFDLQLIPTFSFFVEKNERKIEVFSAYEEGLGKTVERADYLILSPGWQESASSKNLLEKAEELVSSLRKGLLDFRLKEKFSIPTGTVEVYVRKTGFQKMGLVRSE